VPTAFDTPGHIGTGGVAAVSFTAPSGAGATYTAATATCSALYCHGNGRTNSGNVSWTTNINVTCNTCHPTTGLAGEHSKHVTGEGYACYRCHNNTVDSANIVKNKALHINQVKDVALSNGGTYNSGNRTCSSSCHGTNMGAW